MIVTTCEAIPGKELEYIGLVSSATDRTPTNISKKKRIEQCQEAMKELTEDITYSATAVGADAVVGVRPLHVQGMNITIIGTAVKFK
ncbi:MAG: hypothetical protein LUG55_05425 [Clostridiales bacterium]|nr:hypothetical protein [Clostridiales bacterium]